MKGLTILAVLVFAAWMYLGIQSLGQLEPDGTGIIERAPPATSAEEPGDGAQGAGEEYGPGGEPSPAADDEAAAANTTQEEQNSSSEENPPDEEQNPPPEDGVNVTRELPATVVPGQVFDVMVTFTLSDDNTNAIGFHDAAPDGWEVSVDKARCTPSANLANAPDTRAIEYLWFGPYDTGQALTATYKVEVPSGATSGVHTFGDGWFEYYLSSEGPYKADITGCTGVTVVKE